eukprot:5363764-Prymnesium_polylepis.2
MARMAATGVGSVVMMVETMEVVRSVAVVSLEETAFQVVDMEEAKERGASVACRAGPVVVGRRSKLCTCTSRNFAQCSRPGTRTSTPHT